MRILKDFWNGYIESIWNGDIKSIFETVRPFF